MAHVGVTRTRKVAARGRIRGEAILRLGATRTIIAIRGRTTVPEESLRSHGHSRAELVRVGLLGEERPLGNVRGGSRHTAGHFPSLDVPGAVDVPRGGVAGAADRASRIRQVLAPVADSHLARIAIDTLARAGAVDIHAGAVATHKHPGWTGRSEASGSNDARDRDIARVVLTCHVTRPTVATSSIAKDVASVVFPAWTKKSRLHACPDVVGAD